MKPRLLVALAASALSLFTGCDKTNPESAQRLAELERQAAEAVSKQRELEQQLAEQQLAAERDAIERERMRIEEDRLEMERRQSEDAAAEAERLRQREAELSAREGNLRRIESGLEDKEDALEQRGEELNERDRELAGREALANAEDSSTPKHATPVNDIGLFYDSLSPYGSWFETADYGYVWQPVAVRDSSWRPYTRGRWACSDRGWTWISDEPFGWACYHYGRWALCRGFGWVWVPGTEWAPSWVCWRSSGTHIGWAPLPPETLAWRGHRWDSSVEVTFGIGSAWFNFVEIGNFGHPIHYHCLPYTHNDVYIQQTVNITNIHVHNRRVICGGPRYSDVAVQGKRRPPFYRIEENRHAGIGRDAAALRPHVAGNRLHVAAPILDSDWNDAVRPAKVKGRVDQFQIDRKEPLRPEIAERFRQTREENRRKAQETVARLGGAEALQKVRGEQVRKPRSEATRPVTNLATSQPATTNSPRPVAPREGMPPAGSDAKGTAHLRDSGMRPATPPQRPTDDPTVSTPRKETPRREEIRRDPSSGNPPPRPVAPREGMPPAGSDPKVLERLRDSGIRPTLPPPDSSRSREINRRQETPHVTSPTRHEADPAAGRLRRQQEEQAERARLLQQQEISRQREQARQQQAEQTRREQQRQQQLEQQERARRQQEQAERIRDQQERARQQQEQAERIREHQERARQQQEQAERIREQQERARQQQEQPERGRQEEERRGKNR